MAEADSNEGQRIFTEEVRHDALDFVGPCGTPDDGYKVVSTGPDLQIKKDLPLNTPVEIAGTFPKAGKLGYACDMDMIKGHVIVQ